MNNKIKPIRSSLFILLGPFIGLLCITIVFHSHIFFYEPLRFIKGLVTPSIIFPMLAYLLLLTPFSFLIGILPAFITDRIFHIFFKKKIYKANFLKVFIYGCLLGFMWLPILLFLFLLFTNLGYIKILYIQLFLILPTTIICTLLEWRKLIRSQ